MRGSEQSGRRLGIAWMLLWMTLALHVVDEALTGFLSVYNPTVAALRARFGFWPMPTFELREFLVTLFLGIGILAALSPLVFRNVRWMRPFVYFCALVFGVLNALGHAMTTILGHPLSGIQMPVPSPGFWSSPLLLAVSIYVLRQLRRTEAGKPLSRATKSSGGGDFSEPKPPPRSP